MAVMASESSKGDDYLELNEKELRPTSSSSREEERGTSTDDGCLLFRRADLLDGDDLFFTRDVPLAVLLLLFAPIVLLSASPSLRHGAFGKPTRHVAFAGNSMIYFYDLPRLASAVSEGRIVHSSCLRGGAALEDITIKKNGMWTRYRTDSAFLFTVSDSDNDTTTTDDEAGAAAAASAAAGFVDDTVWDFGACTVEMMLFGFNSTEANRYYDQWWTYREKYPLEDDDGAAGQQDGGDSGNSNAGYSDKRYHNPCAQSRAYLNYMESLPDSNIHKRPPKHWDYLVLSDKTKGAVSVDGFESKYEALESIYVPLLEKTKATPIFLVTAGYWNHRDDSCNEQQEQENDGCSSNGENNQNSYEKVPYWTALTYAGYAKYAEYIYQFLPWSQKPKLLEVGIAYLVVYEEDPDLWPALFWVDHKHPSPHGSFLQSCLLHSLVYGHAPRRSTVIRSNMTTLWDGTRTLMYPRDEVVPFPTTAEAEYLLDVCKRVANGYTPKLFREMVALYNLTVYT
jgi:hypothetical protein